MSGTRCADASSTSSAWPPQILRNHAHRRTPGGGEAPRLLFDGRRVSAEHAALANAGTIDSMDGHDGHRLAKGHAGAAVLPAALAFLDGPETCGGPDGRSTHDLVAAAGVGYEVALRAAIALHRSAKEYHSSGAWNSIGAAAVGARLLGLDGAATAHPLGIAEYSAPRGPMMRGVDHPTMVKDNSAWGAQAGVTAALLAAERFTGSPAELVAGPEWEGLGTRWLSLEQYFKPYPVCRWSHPAVQAVLSLLTDTAITVEKVELIEITTFEAATRLGTRQPQTTEEAQYSLPYAVAAALVHRDLTPETVRDPLEATDTQAGVGGPCAGRRVRSHDQRVPGVPPRRRPARAPRRPTPAIGTGHRRRRPGVPDGRRPAPREVPPVHRTPRTGPERTSREHPHGHGRDQHRAPPGASDRPVVTAAGRCSNWSSNVEESVAIGAGEASSLRWPSSSRADLKWERSPQRVQTVQTIDARGSSAGTPVPRQIGASAPSQAVR